MTKPYDCPFLHEPGRKPEELKPCPERYRPTCGCQKDGVPKAGKRYKRSAQ